MPMKQVYSIILLALLWPLILAGPAAAHGDSVVPQVADGTGVIRTKLDIVNLTPVVSSVTSITVKVLFFRQDGSAWSVATNQGTASEFTLNLGRFQTIRVETLGTASTLTTGYAIVRNSPGNSIYDEDYEIATTVYYEILSGSNIVDTVSVPLGQPARSWVFPVEIDTAKELLTGFAIVNLADSSNDIQLKLWKASTTATDDATDDGTASFTLNANQHRARYLNETGFFPSKTSFKGLLHGTSTKPVAILGLLQTSTPGGLQYATLVPAYEDTLRKNTYMYLRQDLSLDADIPISDYFHNTDDDFTWDLVSERQTDTTRRLVPRNGALFSVIGTQTPMQFDALTLEQLKARTYTSDNIGLNDNSANLVREFAFAVKTGMGRYVKIRVSEIFTVNRTTTSGATTVNKDLALEMFVYR